MGKPAVDAPGGKQHAFTNVLAIVCVCGCAQECVQGKEAQ